MICWSPAVQAGAFLWACEVSNSYFYHELDILLPGHIPLCIRQSLGHQGSLGDNRDQKVIGESLDLLSHSCPLTLSCERCKLPIRATPPSTSFYKEIQLQQEQDTHLFYKYNLHFALLSPTPPYFHFLAYSLGFFFPIFPRFLPFEEVL